MLDSFKVWLVTSLSSMKFLTRYYLMSVSYHSVISDYKFIEYNITELTEYSLIILVVS